MFGEGKRGGVVKRVDPLFADLLEDIKKEHEEVFGVRLTDRQASKHVTTTHLNKFIKKGKEDDKGMGIFR